MASDPGSSAAAEKAWAGRGYGHGWGQAGRVDGQWAPSQHGAARRTLTSAEPDSVLLKAVAALVQESLAEAWTGSAAGGAKTGQGVKAERRRCGGCKPKPPTRPPRRRRRHRRTEATHRSCPAGGPRPPHSPRPTSANAPLSVSFIRCSGKHTGDFGSRVLEFRAAISAVIKLSVTSANCFCKLAAATESQRSKPPLLRRSYLTDH